ncbi:unnamed protein product [Rhizoctonia solani]|uniref:BTB domain-containing protein n=1 Tax=Rhizoctonia solani TaxID=456999 RepID=A0A8H3C731_9AGAM|nr:unnamed protein product [Rhizoctonia solani]
MSAEYTIVVSDKRFKLSRTQIGYDSPNFFISHFFGSSDQHTTQELELSRDPYLFAIVIRYLNGYQVLPLHPTLVPPHCTPETALADLRADAQFYQLDGLSNLLSSTQNAGDQDQLVVRHAEVTGHYNTTSDMLEPTENLDKIVAGFSLDFSSKQKYQIASNQDDFFTVPRNTKGGDPNIFFSGLLNERIVRGVLQKEGHATRVSRWELLGWKRNYPSQNCRQSSIFVKLWAEPGLTTNGKNADALV